MKWIPLISAIMLLLSFGPVRAETTQGMARDARQAFEAEDFSKAIEQWLQLRDLGYQNGDLYFNLANAYWRNGQVGQAYRYLLKAIHLSPRNSAIRNNLLFIKEKLGVPTPGGEGPFSVLKRVPWWKLSVNYYESLRILAVLSFLFFGYLFLKTFKKRRPSPWLWIPLALLWLAALGQWSIKSYAHFLDSTAIVLNQGTPLLKAPAAEAVSGLELSEGAEIKVVKKQGDFKLVKTPTGKEGWVLAENIGEVK